MTNHRRRTLATLAILTLTGALVAMEARALPETADRAPAAVTHPAPTGPHAVGRRLMIWTDDGRRDPTDRSRSRELPVWIWYPAPAAASGAETSLPGPWGERRVEALKRRFGAAVALAMGDLRVTARTNAPLLPGTSRVPVVIFTPGLGWLPTDYSVLLEDLASHGYIVVGLAPPGFAEVVPLSDGRDVRRTLGNGAAINTDQAYLFDDTLFAIGQMRRLNDDGFLRGRIDLDRIGTLGHSIGGIASVVAAARDQSVRAAINIDGDPMADAVNVRPRQPLLLVSSESPSITEAPAEAVAERRAQMQQGLERSETRRSNDWTRMSDNAVSAYRIRLSGSRHLNFTDVALASSLIVTPAERWMKVGPIDGTRGLVVTAGLVRSFFARFLLGRDDNGLLRTPHARYPEARLETAGE